MLRLVRDQAQQKRPSDFAAISQEAIFEARRQALEVHLAPALEEYLTQLVLATRDPAPFDAALAGQVEWGASPRGTIALDRCARSRAWLAGRSYVTPEDVHALVFDVLRHRVLLSYEARAEGLTSDAFLRRLLQQVPLP